MQIQPRENFVIARGLEDPSDSTTYYMQAVIRNALTDAVLDTVNLTDNGDRRFTAPWQAPADVSGNGLYILITISVYTDAGYSVRAENYGDSFQEYLVQERLTRNVLPFGGPDAPDIDYKKIEKIVATYFGKIKEPKEQDFSRLEKMIAKGLQDVRQDIAKIEIPEAKELDFAQVKGFVQEAENRLSNLILSRPEFEKTDLSGVLSDLSDLKDKVSSMAPEEAQATLNSMLERIREFFTSDLDKIYSEVEKVNTFLNNVPYVAINKPNSQQP